MHVLIIADLEGAVGVYDLAAHVSVRNLYNLEVESIIYSLKGKGVEKITVCDAHNQGNMLDYERLSSVGAHIISQTWNIPFKERYDVAILTGLHGMRGGNSVLHHTFRYEITRVTVDSISIGEVEVYCRWLGGKQIPVVLVVGDNEAAYEGNILNVFRQTCCVKNAFVNGNIEIQALYDKIDASIYAALKTDFRKCISQDDMPVFLEINDIEVYDRLHLKEKVDNSMIRFESCSELMQRLPFLAKELNSIECCILDENFAFVKEIKEIINNIARESVTNVQIKTLLNKTPASLTREDRNRIRTYFEQITALREKPRRS